MVLPKPGTPEHEAFMRKASRDPNSHEALILKQMVGQAMDEQQRQVRQQLQLMVELVPGQLFRDIGRFHGKFELSPTQHPNHELPEDVVKFRLKFLVEELLEYAKAAGFAMVFDNESNEVTFTATGEKFDAEKAFDGLIDLTYVALGTAFLHRFPFNEGWARVQEANMAKVRATSADDPRSVRKHSTDIVKPEGWKPPTFQDLIGPYAEVHMLLNNHPNIKMLVIVEDAEEAAIAQKRFERSRCEVVEKSAEAGSIYDVVVVMCKVDQEYAESLKPKLAPGGRIVLAEEPTNG